MAFGKKKGEPAGAAETDDQASGEADDVAMDDLLDDGGADTAAEVEAPEAAPAEQAVAAAPAEAPGTDALLSMFQETKAEIDDLAVLVGLATDADLDDILEELRTIRAALGISDAFEDERELRAA